MKIGLATLGARPDRGGEPGGLPQQSRVLAHLTLCSAALAGSLRRHAGPLRPAEKRTRAVSTDR